MRVSLVPDWQLGWLRERTRAALTPDARGLMAVDAGGRIRGMVVFDLWTETSATLHVAPDTPVALRALASACAEYAFEMAGKELLLCLIPAHNRRSLRLVQHLGFELAHRVRDGFAAGDDLLLFEMRKADCRWLQAPHRKAA